MKKKIVIVGGVAGGASFAARMRRLDENAEITLIERGPYISFANCGLPYHIGKVITERDELLIQTAEGFHRRFQVKVLQNTEATSINTANKTITIKDLISNNSQNINFDYLVLSPGAAPIIPNIPGAKLEEIHYLRNMQDMDGIIKRINSNSVKHAVVVGGGFIGIEVAENLVHLGIKTTLVELSPQIMPPLDIEIARPLAQEMREKGVIVLTNTGVTSISKNDNKLSVEIKNNSTIKSLQTDMIIMAVGVKPEIKLAQDAGLTIGDTGAIQVDNQMRTSNASIFAVGDAVEVVDRVTKGKIKLPLAGPANRQGRLVADVIAGKNIEYKGVLGTSILKVFNLVAASTGISEKQAIRQKIPFKCAWVHGNSHAGYYPGATPLTLKLIFSEETGVVLGAQAIGYEGVDKRIDVLAAAVFSKQTVFDLEEMDLAYAPPFSSAKDPVNHLGAIAANMLRGEHPTICWNEIDNLTPQDHLVDVRTTGEFNQGSIPGAINIPLDDLRSRLQELPKNKRLVIYCQAGLRGYLATRILMQKSYTCVNLLGGYKLWQMARS